jgi:hypothetical protein
VFRQSRSGRICSGTASRTEFKEKAYGEFSRSSQPPARSDDKGIGVKALLAIWAAQTEREGAEILCAGPRRVDRTRSLVAVSQKREYFKYSPETIGYFALRMPKIEAWRLAANWQKPANGGPFCEYHGHFLRASDCLAGAGGFEPPSGGSKINYLWASLPSTSNNLAQN